MKRHQITEPWLRRFGPPRPHSGGRVAIIVSVFIFVATQNDLKSEMTMTSAPEHLCANGGGSNDKTPQRRHAAGLFTQQNYVEAEGSFRQLASSPDQTHSREALFCEAECARLMNRPTQAIALYIRLLTDTVDNLSDISRLKLVECYYATGHFDLAFTNWMAFRSVHPEDPINREICERLLQADETHDKPNNSPEYIKPFMSCSPLYDTVQSSSVDAPISR